MVIRSAHFIHYDEFLTSPIRVVKRFILSEVIEKYAYLIEHYLRLLLAHFCTGNHRSNNMKYVYIESQMKTIEKTKQNDSSATKTKREWNK